MLADVYVLYSKLLHTCLIILIGQAFLTRLESVLGIFYNSYYSSYVIVTLVMMGSLILANEILLRRRA
jgi:hypothetical protein